MGFTAQDKRRGLGDYEGGEGEAMKGPRTRVLRGLASRYARLFHSVDHLCGVAEYVASARASTVTAFIQFFTYGSDMPMRCSPRPGSGPGHRHIPFFRRTNLFQRVLQHPSSTTQAT
jgi:hypothetical protein